jgi:F-type H+-transporting ATPase subunit delta
MKVRLAKRYAQALFRLGVEQQISREVEAELMFVEQVFADSDVRAFFANPSASAVSKKETIVRLFGAQVSEFVQNFLCHMTDKRRTDILPEVIKTYRLLVKQVSNILEVEVVTAIPLAEREQEQLVAQLATVTGKTIELHPRVDHRILGGLVIQVGDKRIDNSVVTNLGNLKSYILQQMVNGSEVTNSL